MSMISKIENVGAGVAWSFKAIQTTMDYDNDLKVGYFCQITGTTLKNITKPLAVGTDFIKGVVLDSCCNGSLIEAGLIKDSPKGIVAVVTDGEVTCKIKSGVTVKRGQSLYVVVKTGDPDLGSLTNQKGTAGTDTLLDEGLRITAMQPVGDGAWLVNIT